ncbi:MAG: VOC family protein [Pseudomonadota bacterium]
MYDHVGITVKDLAASLRFYQAALAPLGHVLGPHDGSYAGFGPPDAPALWLYAGNGGNGGNSTAAKTHIALSAADHHSVQAFYQAGLEAGAKDNGAPGPRPDYSPTYYAAFLIDPDGNNVEAVCI